MKNHVGQDRKNEITKEIKEEIMGLRFGDRDWNRLILRNYSIRWLIGDIEIMVDESMSRLRKAGFKLLRIFVHPVFRAVMLLAILQCLVFLVNKYCGTLFIEGEAKGYLEDFPNFGLALSCIIAVSTLRYMLRNFYGAFLSSDLAKRVGPEELRSDFGRYQDILGMSRGSGYTKWAILTFGSAALMIYFATVYLPFAGWQVKSWSLMPSEYPWSYAAGMIEAIICWYCIGANMIWYGVGCASSAYKMLDAMKKCGKVIVTPVSPDGTSDFYVLARFSFALFLMCLSALPFVISQVLTYGITLAFMLLFPVVLVLMGIAFFCPLWPAHSVMEIAKEKELKHISELFRECHSEYSSLKLGDENMEEVLAKMGHLEMLYSIVRRTPVWPFDTRMLVRFLSLILLQLIPFLIKIFSNSAARRAIISWWKEIFG